jgi:hypothetical protein
MAEIFAAESGLEASVAELLGALSADYTVAAPADGERRFSPALISRVTPNAEIPFHFDKFVFYEPTGVEHIKPLIDPTTLLNLQVPIARPERGGDLVVAAYSWEELELAGPISASAHVDTAANAAPQITVPLEVGDFLLFDAGRTCHRITPVAGARDRLTYVSHTAVSRDGREVFYFV